MSISSDQYMQKMETGMVDVRQCVIKMEASLQKLVADSKAMQQLVKQSLAKDKQGAAAGKSDAGADAKKGDSAKSGPLDNVISGLSKKLADGIGSALLKVLGLEEKKKDSGAAGQAQGAGTGAGAAGKDDKAKAKQDKEKEFLESLKGKSSMEVVQMTIDKYAGSAEDANKRIYDSTTSVLNSCSDAFVKFVTTGKFSFNDFAKSVIQNILKIQAQAAIAGLAKFLVGAATTFIGGAFGSPAANGNIGPNAGDSMGMPGAYNPGATQFAAQGYDVPAGVNPVTQLHEKEMVLPAQYADVIRGLANNGGVSGGGININTSISVASDGTSNQKSDGGGSSQRQLADMINDQTRAVIAREMRQGGLIWNMQMGAA